MEILIAVILGAVQGFTEFLPVSSCGHLVILERLTGINVPVLTFHVFLHAGTLLAVILAMRSDLARLLKETRTLLSGVSRRTGRMVHPGGAGAERVRLARTNYQRMALLIIAASVPTALLGFILRPLAEAASISRLYTGIGFLTTGILLLVTDMVSPGSEVPRDVPLSRGILIGVFQGLSVLPGFSRAAFTISTGIFSGFSKKTAIRFSYLLSVPAVLGALLIEIIFGLSGGTLTAGALLFCLAGMAAAAVTGFFAITRCLRLLRRHRLSSFAYYCFFIGALSVLIHYFL